MAAAIPALLAGCPSYDRGAAGSTPRQFVRAVAAALRRGDLRLAEDVLGRAANRYPDNGSVRLWVALTARMRWQDGRALAELQLVDRMRDRGGLSMAQLHGRIGDLMFRLGRYGAGARYLEQGQVGPDGALRAALARLAWYLPYRRRQVKLQAAELPLLEGSLPEMLWSVGGKQRPFVLDTGASFTTLGSSLAREMGVAPVLAAGTSTDGTGHEFPVSVGVLRDLSLGGVSLGPHPVLVVEDGRLALHDPFGGPLRPPSGLIGFDVMSRFRVMFDPGRRSVVFASPRGLPERDSTPCVRLEGYLLVPVHVEGRTLWFNMDTGASDSSLTEEGLRRLPGAVRRAVEAYRRVRSPGGRQLSVRAVRGLTLRVSAARFVGVDLPVIGRHLPAVFPVHGVLGADLLLRCRTTIDSGRVRLEALSAPKGRGANHGHR